MYNWLVKRNISRTDAPNTFGTPDDWITWVPQFDRGGTTRAGARLDVRSYEWSSRFTLPVTLAAGSSGPSGVTGQAGWFVRRVYPRDSFPQSVYAAVLNPPAINQTVPARSDTGGLTADRRRLDVRGYDWSPSSAWLTAASVVAARGGSGPSASRGPGGWFLRRIYDRTTGPQMVYTTTLPPTGATTAQQVPAFAYTGDRTRAGAKLDLFRHQSIPNTFGTPDDWITWTPQFDHGGLIPNHARLDVRQYETTPGMPPMRLNRHCRRHRRAPSSGAPMAAASADAIEASSNGLPSRPTPDLRAAAISDGVGGGSYRPGDWQNAHRHD